MTSYAPLFIGLDGDAGELTAEQAGSKAAQLWRMGRLGLNVPPAFVLPTALCAAINRKDPDALAALDEGLRGGIARLEAATGRRFGDRRAPLLVSVRSGAAKSMPGMLATVLDVGLNADSVHGLISLTGNPRLAWDCRCRFLQMYAEVVEAVPAAAFEDRLEQWLRAEKVASANDLDPEALERLAQEFGAIAERAAGRRVPDDPMAQLTAAARAVYRSWEGQRAREYRRLNGLEDLAGTAVTVQAMVFGNAGRKSGAGVAFSRDPATGAKALYIDFLFDAQGEDVVAGRRMPGDAARLAAKLPLAARELAEGAARLERELRDVQDIEFTVEEGRLFFLQTRAAKRTPRAALRILVDLVGEGLLDPTTALARAADVDPDSARITRFAGPAAAVASATTAAPGVASGRAAFDSAAAKRLAEGGEPVILVRHETSTEDIAGFAVAAGILTAVGGRTAHAAVVARQLGKVCLVGCGALRLVEGETQGEIGGTTLREGDWISLDGDSGEVTLGRRDIVAELPAELEEIARWRRLPAAGPPTASAGER